jgi:hypothetical protein
MFVGARGETTIDDEKKPKKPIDGKYGRYCLFYHYIFLLPFPLPAIAWCPL